MEEDLQRALEQTDPRALGRVVYRLRDKKQPRLTQLQLGKGAGYEAGAGISISRIENGQMKPSSDRFKEIAALLGVTPTELIQEAALEMEQLKREGQDAKSIEDRLAEIRRFEELRSELIDDAKAFERASDRANAAFLVRFLQVAARVQGAPPADPHQLVGTDLQTGDDVEVEAAYQLKFTRFGVEKALSEPTRSPTRAGKIDDTALDGFVSLVSRGSSLLGGVIPFSATTFRSFQRAAGMKGAAASGIAALAVGFTVGAIAAVGHMSRAKRTAKMEDAISADLARDEQTIAQTLPSVRALRESILRATDILDYVAVHAAHALNRWEGQIGEGKLDWESLIEAGNEKRYFDFAEIAAAQLAIVTLSYDDLWKTRGEELERAKALTDEVLSQAQRVIESHV